MTRMLSTGTRAVAVLVCSVVLVGSCSSSTDSPSGEQTVIDDASVARGIAEMGALIPVCQQVGGSVEQTTATLTLLPESRFAELFAIHRDPVFRSRFNVVASDLGSTQPPDEFGECGGRITYPSYSHSNGVTTGVYSFDNYCEEDSQTGTRETIDGDITFVNTGTPSASGPITTMVEASSTGGVSIILRDVGGTTLSSQRYTFTDFEYSVGVPGGTPTASNPNRISAAEIKIVNQLTNKTYRQTDYSASSYNTQSGGEQTTVSGRGYRSSGGYFDVTTTSPLSFDASGDVTGGQLTFSGANNTRAVLTLVPGSVLQGTMTLNGVPVTNVPACQ